MDNVLTLRPAVRGDADAVVWALLEPVFRAGDTYAIDRDIPQEAALDYWFTERVWLAEAGSAPLGTFYMKANQQGGGAHLCNCGFITAPQARGRGVARAMLNHALEQGRTLGFLGMVFNFVVATNTRAIKTWQQAGFDTVGRVPAAFRTPDGTFADALILHRRL